MAASPQDLTTLADVKAWLAITASSDDAVIQETITAASLYWLWRTGRDSLNTIATYTERYDGAGRSRQFLRNSPVTAVTSVTIDGVVIPQSTDFVTPGWVLDQSGKSVALIGSWGGGVRYAGSYGFTGTNYRTGGFIFREGIQNVLVVYSAGYNGAPLDVQTAVKQHVAVNYKRRQWIDQASQVMTQVGTTTYRNWEIPPEVERVILAYTRRAIA